MFNLDLTQRAMWLPIGITVLTLLFSCGPTNDPSSTEVDAALDAAPLMGDAAIIVDSTPPMDQGHDAEVPANDAQVPQDSTIQRDRSVAVDGGQPSDAATDIAVIADAVIDAEVVIDAQPPQPEPIVCEAVLGQLDRPGDGVGQLLQPVETRQVGEDDTGRTLFAHGQETPDSHLVLDVNSGFFSFGSALVLEGNGPEGRPGSNFNNDQSFAYGENWRRPDSGIVWEVEFARAGQVELAVELGVDAEAEGAVVEVSLGEQSARCTTQSTGGRATPRVLWRMRFDVAPGVHQVAITARELARGLVGRFYRADLTGPGATEARVLRARWRPAAVHAQWRSSTIAAPSRLWVMELEPRLEGQGFYAPVTTPFGYFGSPRSDTGEITGVNFSMWSFGRGQEAPPIHQFSHIIAIGSPDGQFGGFSHEGTGAKVRGWNPYAGQRPATQTLALRVVPGDPYDTYYGYYLDPVDTRWKLFAAGRRFNDGTPLTSLTAGAFVEVAGPPPRQRTGQWERKMSYRGWYRDLNDEWHTIDTQQISGSEAFINKRWGITGNQHWMTMGGVYHWQDEPGQRNLVLPNPPAPADRPQYLQGDAVAALETLPALFSITPPIGLAQDGARARFTVEDGGTDPTARLFYGTEDALTFADRWQHEVEVQDVELGVNHVGLEGLMPGTRYYYRALIQNAEGQIWSLETQSFETLP